MGVLVMSLRSPLARARNHGSARDGVHHWWQQRLSAVLLVALTVWLVLAIRVAVDGDFDTARAWMALPWNTVFALLFTITTFYHGQLGLQVIIEDYVHTRWLEVTLQIAVKLFALLFAVMGALAILRIAFGVAPLAG